MLPEAPFLFSLAGLSASLAGLAGLVAALRRGTELRQVDLFRLRQIVEFAFANVLLAVAPIPAAALLGSPTAVRAAAVTAIAVLLIGSAVLFRRLRQAGIPPAVGWYASVAVLDAAALVAGGAAVLTGSFGAYEALLVLLLARPMLAFLLVLGSFEAS